MFEEFSKVMDHSVHNDSYLESLSQNVINKKTKSGIIKTTGYLTSLYFFDIYCHSFTALKYFWGISEEKDKPILALLFAIGQDYLLEESIPVVVGFKLGDKVQAEKLKENIESLHPSRFSVESVSAIVRRLISSWKQSGYIVGKMKNIRTQPDISYIVVAFAFLMAYLNDLRGDFILTSKWVKSLALHEGVLREQIMQAAQRDLVEYQYAGNVMTISFKNLFKKLPIDGF